jgi:PGF-CTERM protein
VKTAGDDEGVPLEVPNVPEDQSTGRYTTDGVSGSPGVTVTTPTPEPTPTERPTERPTPTATATATPTPTEGGGPGFGVVVTLFALVVAACLAIRRGD